MEILLLYWVINVRNMKHKKISGTYDSTFKVVESHPILTKGFELNEQFEHGYGFSTYYTCDNPDLIDIIKNTSGEPTLAYHKTKNILVSSYYGSRPLSKATPKGKLLLKNSLLYIESLVLNKIKLKEELQKHLTDFEKEKESNQYKKCNR
eukprot:UN22421